MSKFNDNIVDYSKLQENFGVKKITFLPQMDYHLDLFIRPLDNKRVLLTDDSLTLKMLETGICKFEEAIKNCKDFNKKERYNKQFTNTQIKNHLSSLPFYLL